VSGRRWVIAVLFMFSLPLHGCGHVDRSAHPSPQKLASVPHEWTDKILALNPKALSETDVTKVLSKFPAPRIVMLDGSLPMVTMGSFAKFLIRMGYPEDRIRDPRNGSYSYSSYRDTREMAGMIAWYYEAEGMMPMVIGHSQGGMRAIEILHEMAGNLHEKVAVWNPLSGKVEERDTIIDPLTGKERTVVGLKLSFTSAVATGKWMRFLLLQWDMLSLLRRIPDSAEEFTGFHLKYDPISGTLFGVGPGDQYYPMGSARVRNVTLPAGCSHLGILRTEDLAEIPETRAWIQRYVPSGEPSEWTGNPEGSHPNILLAADLWYSIKKHWCMGLQEWIFARDHGMKD
jgi:hypothetical protein